MGIESLLPKRSERLIEPTRVLICSLGKRFRDAFEHDRLIYSQFYEDVDAMEFNCLDDLVRD